MTTATAHGSSPLRSHPTDGGAAVAILQPSACRADHPLQGVRDGVADVLGVLRVRYGLEVTTRQPERNETGLAVARLASALGALDAFVEGVQR